MKNFTYSISIKDGKKFRSTVSTIEKNEDFLLIETRTGITIVCSIPEDIPEAEMYGIEITVQEIKEKKPRAAKQQSKEKKKRTFTENQIRHQQEFGQKIREFWKK
jgi:hypothetical protein